MGHVPLILHQASLGLFTGYQQGHQKQQERARLTPTHLSSFLVSHSLMSHQPRQAVAEHRVSGEETDSV